MSYLHCIDNLELNKKTLYSGENVYENFIHTIFSYKEYVEQLYSNPKEMILTKEDEINFRNASKCYLCGNEFNHKNYKVRDHNHINGKYRGAAHNDCNINYKLPNFIDVVFHNLRGYDSHLIIQNLGETLKTMNDYELEVIPTNTQQYLSFTIKKKFIPFNENKNLKIRFIDSLQHMPDSLENLANNLPYEKKIETIKHFKNLGYSDDDIKLVTKKGIFAYDWNDSIEKFNYIGLPPKECFYSQLYQENITDKEYETYVC